MNIAITVWGNRVSPVFDSAQTIMLVEFADEQIISKKREFIANTIPASLARMLIDKGVGTLICGAISEHPAQIIEEAGITLVPFVSGNPDHVLQAYACGNSTEEFMMPGCRNLCCVQNRGFMQRSKESQPGNKPCQKNQKPVRTEESSCQDPTEIQE